MHVATKAQIDALARALCACMGCDPDEGCSDAGHTSADWVAGNLVADVARTYGFALPAPEPLPDLFAPAPVGDAFLSRCFEDVV